MDLSASMGYTYRQELTKFEYGICLAAALGYLMIHQQDPVGLVTFDTQVRQSLPPQEQAVAARHHPRRCWPTSQPTGETDIGQQPAPARRHDPRTQPGHALQRPARPTPSRSLQSLHRLRHRGHDVILFHILDEAEVHFPFEGMVEFEDNETHETLLVDADGIKADYLEEVAAFRATYRKECLGARIDYVPLHTGMPFDKALMSYLLSRQARG